MMIVSVKHNFREQAQKLARLSRDLQEKATAMALNKTTGKAKTEMTRAITSEFNLKAKEVRPRLAVRRASAKGANLVAVLQAFDSPSRPGRRSMNLIHFLERRMSGAERRRREKRGTLKQLAFQIKKRGGTKHIKGAFVTNDGRTVFIREGKGRLPIRGLQTIDVAQMFNTKRINERVVRRIQKEFPIEFSRAVNVLLERSR